MLSESRAGRPRVFVAHGRRDDVLPVERTSGRIVPALRDAGYRVTFRTFGDGHVVEERTNAVRRPARELAW